MYTAILFDLDGTLIDSAADITQSVNHVRQSLGLAPLARSEVVAAVGDGLAMLLQRTVPGAGAEAIERYRAHHAEHCLDHTVLYPGVREGLAAIADRAALGVVTNKPHAFTERILRGLAVEQYFRVVVGGDGEAGRKPDPRPILHALEVLGTGPWNALMAGDSAGDVRAGLAAGTATAFVTWGFRPLASLAELRPDHVLADFAELLPLLAHQDDHVRTVWSLLGAEKIAALSRAFYARVEHDTRIRTMFPRELRAPIEHQVLFLTQFFGGPDVYRRERGHPALRRRHAPFPIDRAAAAAWLENMLAAMQEVAIPEPAAGVMRRYFRHTAAFLINRA
jgi:phosphoglycolate phosphatase